MRKLFLALLMMLLWAIVAASPAMAVGTLAGTTISNQSYGDYQDDNGNALPRVYSNTVSTTVSQVAGVDIIPPTGSEAATNGQVLNYLVQLFNTGNHTDTQTFSYATSGAWTPTTVRMFYDINNNHTYDAGDVLLTDIGSHTFKTVNGSGAPVLINPDDDYDVIMEVTVPDVTAAPNGSSNVLTVTTVSDFDPTKTATGTYTSTVLAAVIAVTKTHTPAGTPTYLQPGETITYTVTLNNTGSTDGTALSFTNVVPANLIYVPGSLMVNVNGAGFVSKSDGANSDGVKYDAGTKTVMAPDGGSLTLPGGQTWVVQFQATVNAGVPSGTAITNQGALQYTSGTSVVTVQSNGDTVLVATLSMIDLNTTTGPKSVDPGDLIVYPLHAVNNGNSADTIELSTSSTAGWTWALWVDNNGDGIPGNAGDYLLTDTNVDGHVDTGSLTQYQSIDLLAVVTIPPGTANGTVDTLVITGVSKTTPSVTDSMTFTTTVTAPVLSITKAFYSVQAPTAMGGATCTPTDPSTGAPCKVYPGSVLAYTVTATNSGSGNMTNLVLSDIVPMYTTYVAGSLTSGSTAGAQTNRTDAADGDGAQYSVDSHAVVIPDGSPLNLGPGGTWVFRFKVMVD